MKVVCISDTHGKHEEILVPEADILIHAGDFSSRGTRPEVSQFLDWFEALPHPYKVFIAGNHDFFAEKEPLAFRAMVPDNCIYLENELATVAGLKIWGSPITPWFFNWAFNRYRGDNIRPYWEAIPEPIDILVTHGPPFEILDRTAKGMRVGCADLVPHIKRCQTQLHVFGHIHEAYGHLQKDGISFVNASNLNLAYRYNNPPIVLEIESR